MIISKKKLMQSQENNDLHKDIIDVNELEFLEKKYIEETLIKNNNEGVDTFKLYQKKISENENERKKSIKNANKEIIDKFNKSFDIPNQYENEYNYDKEIDKMSDDELLEELGIEEDDELKEVLKENKKKIYDIINREYKVSNIKKIELFEKKKFLKATFFMKISNFIGLSIRNEYFKEIDKEVIKAINDNEIYRVLEAEKNGYFLGRKLKKIVFEKLYTELSTKPSALIDELVKRDIMLSYYDHLSLVLYSSEGKDLITGKNPEINPYAKQLFSDLANKNNFLFANKDSWLRTLKNKDKFLSENNPIFYHEKMLAVCEKNELLTVKKVLSNFYKEDDVLKSIYKTKLVEKMLLKIDLTLGNSIDLKTMLSELPKVGQNLYLKINEIKFSVDDIKILESNHKYEYEFIEKRMLESIIKYISVDSEYRNTLKSSTGKTAEELLIETLENILMTKDELKLLINQQKLTDLSITRRYTDSIRGDAGIPSVFQLKTARQLKETGELLDLIGETNTKNNIESNEKNDTIESKSKFKIKI